MNTISYIINESAQRWKFELTCPNCITNLEIDREGIEMPKKGGAEDFEFACPECKCNLKVILRDGFDVAYSAELVENEFDFSAKVKERPKQKSKPPSSKNVDSTPEKNTDVDSKIEEKTPLDTITKDIGNCIFHKDAKATENCYLCQSAICDTCDFYYPESGHFCPKCIVNFRKELSQADKNNLIGAFICAVFASLLFIISLAIPESTTELDGNSTDTISGLLIIIAIVAAIIGAVKSSKIDKSQIENTIWVWVAQIWNYSIIGMTVLLMIAGLLYL